MSQPRSLPLLAGNITLSEALDDEDDVLQKISYPERRLDFYQLLHVHAGEIQSIVSHHLGVSSDACRVPWVDEWVHGSFNVCIPVYVDGGKRFIIRFPLPYKIGESTNPGNAEEKLRCEAATYAWIQSHCPEIPVPQLWGFCFSGGASFTALGQAPLLSQLGWYLRRSICWVLGRPAASNYVAHPHRQKLSAGYLLMDYVDDGRMLSQDWKSLHVDDAKRSVLYCDLSRIMVSLARVPFPRIGSLTMDNGGVVSLANRPLGLHLHQIENDGINTGIPRDLTYAATDTYLLDRLACHDSRVRWGPNSILSHSDGEGQMSSLTIMRALAPHFTSRERRQGPFVLMLTDLHPSNIFVGEDGRVTKLIDLEWACALPAEMLLPPYWLTNRAIDQLTGEHLVDFGTRHEEFVSAFAAEEESASTGSASPPSLSPSPTPLADMMRAGWASGGFWYWSAVDSSNGLYNLFLQHIQGLYGQATVRDWKEFEQSVAPYWATGAVELIENKLQDRERYLLRVREAFGDRGGESGARATEEVNSE